ncbi:hemolysin family protein [Isoptericola sp. AK164]|uniref:hemolysin family protein n=1 Tax=Isoptericola sp. AK164 TaxID=3024246 RepID=UPI0024185EA3|nr:hemolysin family protein [Isoptericola sp. AK164]
MSTGTALLIGLLLLVGNAFFVGAEFAVLSVRRSTIEPRAQAGEKRAKVVLWAMENVSLMLACAQLGITVCSTGLGIIAEPALAHLLEGPFERMGIPEQLVHPVALVIALGIVVYLHVVLGEMVPKNLAVTGPERAALWFAPPLVFIARVVRPIIVALNWVANHVIRMLGVEPKDEVASAFTVEEVQSIVEASRAEGVLEDDQGLLTGAIEFSSRTARDVMVPVDALVTVSPGATPDDVEHEVSRTGYSRFPMVEPESEAESVEDGGGAARLLGYLHLKDVLYATNGNRSRPVPMWRVRAMATVDPTDEVEDTLRAMQRSGAHLARVDDAGRTVGVVFLEDILEELVGEVRDAMQRRR